MKQFVLFLYVLRTTRTIERTVRRLRELCESEQAQEYTIKVINLAERPRLASDERILAFSELAGTLPPLLRPPIEALFRQDSALIGLDVSIRVTESSRKVGRRVTKTASDIPGFDFIADGGLPHGRATLVAGTSGAGKTVFSSQFLTEGIIRHREPGIFVTFEEQPDDIRSNMSSFDWDIERWEEEGFWSFVDASPDPSYKMTITGEFEFDALIARIRYAAEAIGARRAALDSIGTIFSHFPDTTRVRYELFRMISSLRELGVTAVLTAERLEEYGSISRHGVEEFAADNVVILRNVLEAEKRRRTIEILKMRGASHKKGEYPFTIMPNQGVVIVPHALELEQASTTLRVSSGNAGIDEMYGGGLLRDSTVLVSGPTGTGKTMLAAHFVNGATAVGERALYFGFEESRQQLARNALGWGIDFGAMEAAELLKVVCHYPEDASLSDHLVLLERTLQEFRPSRLVLDSISALERISSVRGFREFLLAVTSLLKQKNVTGLFTTTAPMVGIPEDPKHVSGLTDAIVLLRLFESRGDMLRGINILKMRGSPHDTRIRQFHIDDQGIHVGGPFAFPVDAAPAEPEQTAAITDAGSGG
jgi:circadian clock protein KaiC